MSHPCNCTVCDGERFELMYLRDRVRELESERNRDIKVRAEWRGDALYWVFYAGKLSHTISDKDFRVWLRRPGSQFELERVQDDTVIRAKHTWEYINTELRQQPQGGEND